jgi:hypothetical protein
MDIPYISTTAQFKINLFGGMIIHDYPAKMFVVSICDLYCHPNAEKLNTAMETEPFVDA